MKESDLCLLFIGTLFGIILGIVGFYIDPIEDLLSLTMVLLTYSIALVFSFISYIYNIRGFGK